MLFVCGGSLRAVAPNNIYVSAPYRSSQSVWDEALRMVDMRNLNLKPQDKGSSLWELFKADELASLDAIHALKLRERMKENWDQIKLAKTMTWVQKVVLLEHIFCHAIANCQL